MLTLVQQVTYVEYPFYLYSLPFESCVYQEEKRKNALRSENVFAINEHNWDEKESEAKTFLKEDDRNKSASSTESQSNATWLLICLVILITYCAMAKAWEE
ncbi:uncharacterized protein MONOS_2356 [Monocercomonoides exilis]|uniref:uncharacterized protein n=1 Tax=Monocercomonoides exilis TaxID=2049356 RepID=UPI003559978A|nr:hypothetical protein MONOS_2356 [Monocercomonoides exilis]|eukprot:MONOS_2356.1-p1 / transcript=MONOS_2356.1 / gene=MONOS_2356 / organism=Monocercomonoides_exilis_PA203 / gene_product=unspecified product / transcript_product=unspecified product / location=Mono_scaffold00048:75925-76304(+) / protein_length=101 / sequence_SO=supercontig / SO=protein_coding / is_pseudo=false